MADSVTLTGADLLAARVMWYSGALFWGLTLAVLYGLASGRLTVRRTRGDDDDDDPADWWKRLTV